MFFTFCGHFDFGVIRVFYTGVGTHALPRGMQMVQTLLFVNPWTQRHDDAYPLHFFWEQFHSIHPDTVHGWRVHIEIQSVRNQLCIAHFRAPKLKASRKLDILCTVRFGAFVTCEDVILLNFPGRSKFQAGSLSFLPKTRWAAPISVELPRTASHFGFSNWAQRGMNANLQTFKYKTQSGQIKATGGK